MLVRLYMCGVFFCFSFSTSHYITFGFVCTFLCVLLLFFALTLSMAGVPQLEFSVSHKQTNIKWFLSLSHWAFQCILHITFITTVSKSFFFSLIHFQFQFFDTKNTQIFYQCHTYGLCFYNKQNTNFNENNFSTGPIYNRRRNSRYFFHPTLK